jgi:hypothetical protein
MIVRDRRRAALPPLPVGMVKASVNRLAGAFDDLAAHMDGDQFALTTQSEHQGRRSRVPGAPQAQIPRPLTPATWWP